MTNKKSLKDLTYQNAFMPHPPQFRASIKDMINQQNNQKAILKKSHKRNENINRKRGQGK